MNRNKLALILAAGTAASIGPVALAQPQVVSIAGATLLENFFRARASTIDYIDADQDGIGRVYPGAFEAQIDQLAPFGVPAAGGSAATWSANQKWAVVYGAVGSTNGFQELIDWGRTFTQVAGSNTNSTSTMRISVRTAGYYNRYRYINAGAANNDSTGSNPEVPVGFGAIFNSNNPAGSPVRSNIAAGASQFQALYTTAAFASTSPNEGLTATGGFTVDIAPLDVPTTWAVTIPGSGNFERNPQTAGYGTNAGNPVDVDGTRRNTGSRSTALANLTGGANLFVDGVTPNANTIFDNALVHAAVAPIVNFGLGISQIDMTGLRHLYTAGRERDGQNYMVVTRDSGSGTRNAWDNSLGLDPSWANGDNAGVRNNGTQFDRLGPIYVPSNKGGNNRVEPATINHRLAIGYVGPERGVEQGWLTGGQVEIAAVRNDYVYGGTQYVRPTLNNQLDNNANGWVIWGPSVLATFGDARANSALAGGLGFGERFVDANSNGRYDLGETFFDDNANSVRDQVEARPADSALNPAMRNPAAAAYINNITRSIAAFVATPGGDNTTFTPGEFGATQFILLGAVDNVKQTSPSIDPVVNVPNPALNQTLQDFIRNSGNVYNNNAYTAFGLGVSPTNTGNSRAGKVPTRSTYVQNDSRSVAQGGSATTEAQGTLLFSATVNATTSAQRLFVTNFLYSDSALVPSGGNYITQGGTALSYASNLPLRNAVAGDFNADGVRNSADIAQMISAWRARNGGPAWTSPAATGALAALATSTGQVADAADACIEILGDFNGDGSFTALDVRYFADGLATVTDASTSTGLRVDRKAGFTAVDSSFAGNFFGTALATPKVYANGDSRGDVSNARARVAPGYAPIGANGGNSFDPVPALEANRIDGYDISYVQAQFTRNSGVSDGALNWSNIAEATGKVSIPNPFGTAVAVFGADLSADMTGDLIINQADVVELVTVILGTSLADVNLDGSTNSADRTIIQNSITTAPAAQAVFWGNGDLNGDGVVNAADLAIYDANAACGPSDVAGPGQVIGADGQLTADDIIVFIGWFFASDARADVAGAGQTAGADGQFTADDIILFINRFFAGC
jgi:hypothetical protein